MYANSAGLLCLHVLRRHQDPRAAVTLALLRDLVYPGEDPVDLSAEQLEAALRINRGQRQTNLDLLSRERLVAMEPIQRRPLRYRLSFPVWPGNQIFSATETDTRLAGFVWQFRDVPRAERLEMGRLHGSQLCGVVTVVARQKGLEMVDAALLVHLTGIAYPAGETETTLDALHGDTRVSRHTLRRSLERLRLAGLVRYSPDRTRELSINLTVERDRLLAGAARYDATGTLLRRLLHRHLPTAEVIPISAAGE